MVDPLSPPPYNQQVAHGRKLTVGILCIVLAALGLGWIGIPKFMLGFNRAGLITLLILTVRFFSYAMNRSGTPTP